LVVFYTTSNYRSANPSLTNITKKATFAIVVIVKTPNTTIINTNNVRLSSGKQGWDIGSVSQYGD
jgi:hypothetical protein